MRRGREVWAMVIAAVVILLFIVAFFGVEWGFPTSPVDRVDEQNLGVNAPNETVGSPGTEDTTP